MSERREISRLQITRRHAALLLASAVALSRCSLVRWEPNPPPLKPGTPSHIIDAHCHVFNAHDIPAVNYTIYVIAREHDIGPIWVEAAGVAVWLLKYYLDHNDPEAVLAGDQVDAALVERERSFEDQVYYALVAISRAAATAPSVPVKSRLQETIERDLKANGFPPPPQTFTVQVGTKVVRANYEAAVLYRLGEFYDVPTVPVPSPEKLEPLEDFTKGLHDPAATGPFSLTPYFGNLRSLAKAIAEDAANKKSVLGGLWLLVLTLTQRREENIQVLDKSFGLNNGFAGVQRFYMPSTIDFDCWLGDDAKQSYALGKQARIMAELSTRQQAQGVFVHGYMAFDPLRAVLNEAGLLPQGSEDPHEVVRHAICSHGYVGVKIYPPMGFRAMDNPTDNAKFGCRMQGWIAKLIDKYGKNYLLGPNLDRHLKEIYRFCLTQDVPILAHCSNSQTAFPESGLNAEPNHWLSLLKRTDEDFHNLRLNLGHFGSYSCHTNEAAPSPVDDASERCKVAFGWTAEIVCAIQEMEPNGPRYPNLYFDISDLSELVDGSNVENLRKFLLDGAMKVPSAVMSRMLYGTDWMFLATVGSAYVGYLNAVTDFVQRLGGSPVDVFSKNAAAFMGLKSGDATLKRLCAFYKGDLGICGRLESFGTF